MGNNVGIDFTAHRPTSLLIAQMLHLLVYGHGNIQFCVGDDGCEEGKSLILKFHHMSFGK